MLQAKDFVQARLYQNEEAVIQDALRSLLQEKPQMRIELAIHRYQTEDISLARAASLAGVSFDRMKEILVSRGVYSLGWVRRPRKRPRKRSRFWGGSSVKVIANTTVISNFASVGRLDLLQALLGEVFISSGVYDEIQNGLQEGHDFCSVRFGLPFR